MTLYLVHHMYQCRSCIASASHLIQLGAAHEEFLQVCFFAAYITVGCSFCHNLYLWLQVSELKSKIKSKQAQFAKQTTYLSYYL